MKTRLCLLSLLGVAALGACGDPAASGTTDGDTLLVPDVTTDTAPDTAPPDTTPADTTPADTAPGDTSPAETTQADTTPADTDPGDTTPTDTSADTTEPDTAPADTTPTDTGTDVGDPNAPVTVSRPHWRLTFEDDFRGKTGLDTDTTCFDTLRPQCHIWPGGRFPCDLVGDDRRAPFEPLRANLVAALKTVLPGRDLSTLSLTELKALYGETIATRLAALDKCRWTLYTMLNWMATDYQGHWSARFDATQVEVDPSGKGRLLLSAVRAPVETSCVFGGAGGDPNCQIHAFAPNVLKVGVSYWVDPDPRWPGVYYAAVNGGCPHGGTFTGVNCTVYGFPPNVLEARDVSYWADPDPRWPGVYYANRAYACRDNIDYAPELGFRNLSCPILMGGVAQRRGRFEAKAKIPKGIGAFPATWLMPIAGGWPYDGGEIDVMEARDNADEVYQTYHHGKCYNASTGQRMAATDSADCASKGGTTTHMSKGFTTRQRTADEFWKRDHLFAVEWVETPNGDRLDYFINGVKTGSIGVGTAATLSEGAPPGLAPFAADNFPSRAFYWILNHSTWVGPNHVATFQRQVFSIDYVRNYVACGTDPREYCPRGGTFLEGQGCVEPGGRVSPSPCAPADRPCVNGGEPDGARCRVWSFAPGELDPAPSYWVDADPRWPGVYYAKVNGACPYGGSGTVNCQVLGFPGDLLEEGVTYRVDRSTDPPGVFYTPDFR